MIVSPHRAHIFPGALVFCPFLYFLSVLLLVHCPSPIPEFDSIQSNPICLSVVRNLCHTYPYPSLSLSFALPLFSSRPSGDHAPCDGRPADKPRGSCTTRWPWMYPRSLHVGQTRTYSCCLFPLFLLACRVCLRLPGKHAFRAWTLEGWEEGGYLMALAYLCRVRRRPFCFCPLFISTA